MRIVFAGTPEFAVPPLLALVSAGFLPVAALTQPDRRAGRGLKLQASPVKQAAEVFGIAIYQPDSLKTAEFQQWLSETQPDLLIVVAYGLILPQAVLDIPRFGCWNIHASLLPRWRGAAPIQRAIEAGDRESGVCIMLMDAGLDTGAVLARESILLASDETSDSLHDKLAELGAESLLQCLQKLQSAQSLAATPQSTEGITYAHKLNKAEAQINWQDSAIPLEQRIRAFNPWPVCWCDVAGERTRIWLASAETRAKPGANVAGAVISADDSGILVACGSGQLRITQIQRPGGNAQSAREYLQGRSFPARLTYNPLS
ncbi:MAG: methionyl-tRNA formyltransferase [Xanthomonadales bacterium]|nr:methionyl-tRNA formyltransferase [Xanthomonadales bacterium]